MSFKTSLLRSELKLTKSAINSISVQLSRDAQDKLGLLMSRQRKNKVTYEQHSFDKFEGEWIQFGSEKFPDWASVLEYLL